MTRKERISWLEMYSWHNLHEDTLAEIMGVIAAGTIAGSGIPDLLAENQRLRALLDNIRCEIGDYLGEWSAVTKEFAPEEYLPLKNAVDLIDREIE